MDEKRVFGYNDYTCVICTKKGDFMDLKISPFQMQGLTSIKQALGMANLQKAMSQDAQSMDALVKMMEQSVTPHKGQNVDIKL